MLSTRVALRKGGRFPGHSLHNVRRSVRVYAEGPDNGKDTRKTEQKTEVPPEKLRAAVEKLKKDGIDEKVARKVLQSWRRQEVKDASAFSKKTRGDGISRVGLGAVQVFTDVLAAFCCSVTAETFGNTTSFGAGTISIGFQLLFFYFAAGAFLDLFRLGAIIGTAAGLGANSKTLYAAIETLAGDNTGLALVDKAQAAVSSTKIVLALNSVRRVLKEEMDDAAFTDGTLQQLSAYFVLTNAEKDGKWKVSDVPGLTQSEAMKAAGVFAKYDANEDYKLEIIEFKKIVDDADFTLTEEEVKAGMEMMDKNANGVIEFDEFAAWWAALPSRTTQASKA